MGIAPSPTWRTFRLPSSGCSLLAAVALVDEQRWDGQERSTRYQNFRKSGWYTPIQRPVRRADGQLHGLDRGAVCRLRPRRRGNAGGAEASDCAARGDEGRGLPAHAEGTRLRRGALPAAAGDQHLAGADRQRAHAGEPDLAAAGERVCRGAQPGRKAQGCRGRARVECHPRRGARPVRGGWLGG